MGCCGGLGDTTYDIFGTVSSDPTVDVASSYGGVDWNAIAQSTIPGALKTAEQIAIMQTTPAGRYVQTGPGGSSVVYQQPTGPGATSFGFPGLSTFGSAGLSTGTILLIGGVLLAILAMKK